jgi:hypothetical protein
LSPDARVLSDSEIAALPAEKKQAAETRNFSFFQLNEPRLNGIQFAGNFLS